MPGPNRSALGLPEEFCQRMQELLQDDYPAYCQSFSSPRVYGLRTNSLKISPSAFLRKAPFCVSAIPWISNGFYYEGKEKPAKHPAYYAGWYYLQEPSAMTPAENLPIKPGMRVLDICAAPGGKSTELAARLAGHGLLVANDISASRASALLKNLEVFGVENACITSEAPYRLAEHFPGFFDAILVDAPCSGEGMFRKDQAVMRHWTPSSNDEFSRLQKEILTHCMTMLRPGGHLLYSTCTFSMKEDEDAILFLLRNYPCLTVEAVPHPYEGFVSGMIPREAREDPVLCDNLTRCIRIFPHKMEGEGHFLALLADHRNPAEHGTDQVKTETVKDRPVKKQGSQKAASAERFSAKEDLPPELAGFLSQIRRDFDIQRIRITGGKVTYVPEVEADLSGLRIMRCGLLLGECKTRRFEPSQALAMALTSEEFPNHLLLSGEDDRTIRYLKGESLFLSPEEENALQDGYVLVCWEGSPLGFAKKKGNSLKNHYLSGWRWQ